MNKTTLQLVLVASLAMLLTAPAALRAAPTTTPAPAVASSDPPDVLSFSFKATSVKVLPGESAEKAPGWNCRGVIGPADQIGRLAIVSTHFQNGCYTGGKYNHRNYKVEQGTVADASAKKSYEAYRVHGPAVKALKFLGSRHVLFYKVPTKADYTVYRFEGGSLSKAAVIPAASADPNNFVKLDINASTIGIPVIYLVVLSTERVSALASLGNGVDGARLKKTALGDLFKYRYSVTGTPFDTATGFEFGPSTHQNMYGDRRRFFPAARAVGGMCVTWQDVNTQAIHITSFSKDMRSQTTKTITNTDKYLLAASASDGKGTVYLMTIQDGDGSKANQARGARLLMVNRSTAGTRSVTLDTSKKGLNVTMFANRNSASMMHHKGQLGLILSRKMHRGGDGLNHQGAIAALFDATKLTLIKNFGQTSGHSFGNVLTVAGNEFVAADLGDNYPRGVHLHTFDSKRRRSAVVFTFKTEHGQRAASPSGRRYAQYTEISRHGKNYYKWSNDNRTYSELGGVVAGKDGYVVVFASEAVNGKALDNARVGNYVNDPRNIGLVRVRSDFEKSATRGNVIADDMVLTSGAEETGGFFTFNGTWSKQRNKGVVWLTHYKDARVANVSRLKAVGLASGDIVLLWEKWTPTRYVSTHAIKVDSSGKNLAGPIELGSAVRLHRSDDPLVIGNDIYLTSGDKAGKNLEVVVLRVK